MTPRSVAGLNKSDFARQLAERDQSQKPDKKFRSFAPKGSKIAAGYTDRAHTRTSEEDDERAVRLKALEEALKKEEIDQETFDKVRIEIAGGDLSSTHLVKGLDFKLLQRIKQGENVYEEKKEQEDGEEAVPEDVDDEFERLEQAEIAAIEKGKASKKGQLSTVPLNPSKKRTRDQILAEMKAARDAAKAAKEQSSLGTKFRKIGANTPGSRVERDKKGREILIITDERGNEKRMVRRAQPAAAAEEEANRARELLMPDKNAKPLGMEVPDAYKQKAEEPEDEDIDIFDGAGDDYDPLAGLSDSGSDDDDGSDSSGEEEGELEDEKSSKKLRPSDSAKQLDKDAMPPPPRPAASSAEPRNYFKDSKTALASSETLKAPSMSDPTIQAALKKAASLRAIPRENDDDEEGKDRDSEEARAKAERRRKMLQNDDRDLEDMDMGFGTSRFEDEADFDNDNSKIKLARWGEDGDGDGAQGGAGGGSKRKRGPKKRKGDANNAADVLRAMEKQRGAK
ncbi:hypothetical protein SLS62_001143 [Diatrype stigma]|uniref:RED-like N-terminal domain-containing protein n=1 Tax=Diatrype stigma TaxID=117547 RepID=A0AAN9V0D5_9PEZI